MLSQERNTSSWPEKCLPAERGGLEKIRYITLALNDLAICIDTTNLFCQICVWITCFGIQIQPLRTGLEVIVMYSLIPQFEGTEKVPFKKLGK